ncbi:MAG: hypothetical protein BHV90_02855 [Clostridiales bacterium 42_27]|nr:MAG: hypothetical protein BHV90_02855 [Clostridiales bacterium 42_27]
MPPAWPPGATGFAKPIIKLKKIVYFITVISHTLENILLLSYKISKTIECSLGQMKTPGGASSGGFHYSLLVLGSYSISVHIIRIEGSCSDSASQTLKQITM